MNAINPIPNPRVGDGDGREPTLGEVLKVARARRNLTQMALARRCGVSHSVISRLESGQQRLNDVNLLRRLADALEMSPSELVLGSESRADARTGASRRETAAGASRPAQLPADIPGFVARDLEFGRLSELLRSSRRQPTSLAVCSISGTAGVGKSALAVRWAHSVADRFPDGQLYVKLRGVDPAGPTDVGEALRGLLDALGADPKLLPTDLEGQAAKYRSLLSGKRLLVLLDDAYDSNQVRPLLPGSPTCFVVVTSRKALPGLMTKEGARPLSLDLLKRDESRELLARRVGGQRIADETRAVGDIIDACAQLPIALAIVGARAEMYPQFSLTSLATELRDSRARLGLILEEPGTSIRAIFSWSYQQLSPEAQRLFRLLGIHPGPDVSASAVASLAALPLEQTMSRLDELTRAHLVTERTLGRFDFHDLLRAYAAELCRTGDSPAEREAANLRLLDHYLHTAHEADRRLRPNRDPVDLGPPAYGLCSESLQDSAQALDWFQDERQVLRRVMDQAIRSGHPSHTWALAWSLDTFLDRRGHRLEYAAVWRAAVEAARSTGNLKAEGRAHRGLGHVYNALSSFDAAHSELRRSLRALRNLDDPLGQAHTYGEWVATCAGQGRFRDALGHARRGLSLFRKAKHRHGEARCLNDIAYLLIQLSDFGEAASACEDSLALHQELDDLEGAASAWDTMGHLYHRRGRLRQAVGCFAQALTGCRELGDHHHEVDIQVQMGDVQLAMDQLAEARETWKSARHLAARIHHPDLSLITKRLTETDATESPS